MYTHTFSYYFPLWFIKGYWIQFPGLYNRAFSSVQFSCSVMSDSLQHHGLSITNSQSLLRLMSIKLVMPSNHLILFCPLSSCLQSFPASGSFLMSQFFASGGQSIGLSASTSEKAMATHSSTLAWKIPWTEKPGRLQSMGSQRVGHGWATSLSLSLCSSYSTANSSFLNLIK